MREITEEKLKKYIAITEKAIKKAEKSKNRTNLVKEREDCLDMIKRYFSDALHLNIRKLQYLFCLKIYFSSNILPNICLKIQIWMHIPTLLENAI